MKRKKTLLTTALLLFALGLLSANPVGVTAVPWVSPYIMVVPDKILNTAMTPGTTFEVEIYTNYYDPAGGQAWSWQFGLAFNPAVLEGVSVLNGDLISGPLAVFSSKGFNNTIGRLLGAVCYFDHDIPPPPTTNGPGTLAIVTFRVKAYGSSDITLVESAGKPTALLGYDDLLGYYEIIDGQLESEKIGHGRFNNKLPGDVDDNREVEVLDLFNLSKAYGSHGPACNYPLELPSPNWNPECDFNWDLRVAESDLLDLSNNYGESV